jgi:hypothetical protein
VQREAVRALAAANSPRVREALANRPDAVRGRPGAEGLAEQLQFALTPPGNGGAAGRPSTEEEWRRAVREGGDARAGWRVFHHLAVGVRVRGRSGCPGLVARRLVYSPSGSPGAARPRRLTGETCRDRRGPATHARNSRGYASPNPSRPGVRR